MTSITNQSWASSSVDLNNLLHTSGAETVSGKKTFTTLPETSVAATTNNQLTNKKYVDDAISAAIGNINTILATLTTPSNGGA